MDLILAAHPYAPVLALLLTAIGITAGILVSTHFVGPKRTGVTKQDTYEAGMPTIGDARRRFNVKFYLVAMMFLLFDVEIVFLWPWATAFYDEATGGTGEAGFLLAAMAIFFGVLTLGFIYDWGKGIFRWT